MNPIYRSYIVRSTHVLDNVEIGAITYDTGTERGIGQSLWLGRYSNKRVASAELGVITVNPGEIGGGGTTLRHIY